MLLKLAPLLPTDSGQRSYYVLALVDQETKDGGKSNILHIHPLSALYN